MRKRIVAVICVALSTLLISVPAFAAGQGTGNVRHGLSLTFDSWPAILAGLCGVGATNLTAILTHRNAPQWVKSGVNFGLTTLAGVLLTVIVVPGKTWKDYVGEIVATWVSSVIAYVAGLSKLAAAKSANLGLGANARPLADTTSAKRAA